MKNFQTSGGDIYDTGHVSDHYPVLARLRAGAPRDDHLRDTAN